MYLYTFYISQAARLLRAIFGLPFFVAVRCQLKFNNAEPARLTSQGLPVFRSGEPLPVTGLAKDRQDV